MAIATLAAPRTAFCEPVKGDLVILFDQSASMQEYPPRLIAKLWLQTFLNTFGHSRHVAITGFDEKAHILLRVHSADSKGLKSAKETLDKTPSTGRVTDFERAFSFLLDYPDEIALVVIVSDGIPDIYDEKFKQLSKTVRSDPRYADLNKRYTTMWAQGLSRSERFERLNKLYEERNLELIRLSMARLKKKFDGRLVFLDVAGKAGHFNEWSTLAGGKLITVSGSDGKKTADRLRAALATLQSMTSEQINEKLPEDHSERIEVPRQPDATKAVQTVTPKVPASPAPAPPLERKSAPAPFSRGVILIISVMMMVAAAVLYRRIRTNEDISKETYSGAGNDDIPETGPQAVEDVPEDIAPSFAMLDESVYIDSVRRKYGAMAAMSPEAARQYIDSAINEAREAGDEARIKLLEAERRRILFDRRISLRVAVPHGAMHAWWTDGKGQKRKTPVINISMYGALLDAPDFASEKIDEIVCAKPEGRFIILNCRISRRSESLIVVTLDEFEDNVPGKMKWIETLTRITGDK
jgi:hypothetical protein